MRKLFFLVLASGCMLAYQQVNAQVTDSLHEYTGTYVFPDGSVVPDVTVELTDTTLTMTSTAGSSILIKQDKDLYMIVEFSGTALFKRSDAGKINAVHIEAGGYILDGTKKEEAIWSDFISRKAGVIRRK